MMKVNDKFVFPEELDLDSVLDQSCSMPSQRSAPTKSKAKNKDKNVYQLHAILMHKGDIGFGHYFAYIRPTIDDEWYEFNDQRVTPALKGVIF